MPILDKQVAIFWGKFVEIAYAMYSAGVTQPPQPKGFPGGWNMTHSIIADTDVANIRQAGFTGVVAQSTADPNKYCVIFRGTESPLEWVQDFEFCLEPFNIVNDGGRTERGFTDLYKSLTFTDVTTGLTQNLKDYLDSLSSDSAASFVVAGASLGGSLATLHGAVLASQGVPVEGVYTYGSPMVGDSMFAKTYDTLVPTTYRIVNQPDIVPKLPGTLLDYAHVNTEYVINTLGFPEIKRSIACYHHLESYLVALGSTDTDLGACRASAPPKA